MTRFPLEPQKKPVLFHAIRTASKLYELGYEESVCIAGLLHDAIEDTDISYDEISELFGPYVAGIVLANSKDPHVPKDRTLEDIVSRSAGHSREALVVKAAEMHDNWIYYRRGLAAGDPTESEILRCETIAGLVLRHKRPEWGDSVFDLVREVVSDQRE